ncbi:hypothetical protein EYF80_009916 [Liparis tanakae]|uniref:Uncharacterized protein n=1 Tax=Liparis tanakae TaxID=230148 RepID=A0A4Z2IPD5_9TELE|nr:hypothetical protein EYF80_009916 [Liparis tanakae]
MFDLNAEQHNGICTAKEVEKRKEPPPKKKFSSWSWRINKQPRTFSHSRLGGVTLCQLTTLNVESADTALFQQVARGSSRGFPPPATYRDFIVIRGVEAPTLDSCTNSNMPAFHTTKEKPRDTQTGTESAEAERPAASGAQRGQKHPGHAIDCEDVGLNPGGGRWKAFLSSSLAPAKRSRYTVECLAAAEG